MVTVLPAVEGYKTRLTGLRGSLHTHFYPTRRCLWLAPHNLKEAIPMITNPEESLAYFDSIHRRTERDIAALPPAAENWAPPAGEGDQGWSIADIVHHIAESRIFFANAYRGEGWIYNWPVPMADGQSSWLPGLEASVAEFHQRINSTPKEWLTRRVAMLDSDGHLERLAHSDDVAGARGAPPFSDRHLCGFARLGCASNLRPLP